MGLKYSACISYYYKVQYKRTKQTAGDKVENQIITIPIQTTMDPSTLLDITYEIAERLREEIEAYGEEIEIDEEEICIERGE